MTDQPNTPKKGPKRPPKARHSAVAVCLPGLESFCVKELAAIGIDKVHAFRGGINFTATTRQIYALNVGLRSATRILIRLARFDAHNWEEMVQGLDMVDWGAYLAGNSPVRFRVSSKASRLYHTGGITERVAGHLRVPASESDEDDHHQLLVIRVSHNQFTVSIDTSGDALHRRGWRQAVAKAPVRESVAASLLAASDWEPGAPLVDPMCGSGTFAIEAALLSRGIAPGSGRQFAFQSWPGFEPGTWGSVKASIESTRKAGHTQSGQQGDPIIYASDRDAGAVRAATENAERAGVADDIVFSCHSVSDFSIPPSMALRAQEHPGLLVSNPPYGIRIAGGDLRNLYARLGEVARANMEGWKVALLTTDSRTAGHAGFKLTEQFRTQAGSHAISGMTGVVGS